MVKAVIFDCFGVVITDALEALTKELALSTPDKVQQIVDIVVANNRGMIDAEEGRQQVATLLGLTYSEYRRQIAHGEVKDERLLRYIADLRQNYKTAMLSNVSGGGLAARFSDEELADAFDLVVASSDIGFAKPEAGAYEYVADRLGVRLDECVFLDDRQDYCEAAQGTGMRAIRYENFTQATQELEKILASA